MKFSGKIKDGTSNKTLNFGCEPNHGCLLVALFFFLFVCLLAGLLKMLLVDFDEIFWNCRGRYKEQSIKFWLRSRSWLFVCLFVCVSVCLLAILLENI